MAFILVESPFAANDKFTEDDNIAYAKECCHSCLANDEVPFASHLFYTQDGLLDDDDPTERGWGIHAGLEIGKSADKSIIFVDHGISTGMKYGIEAAINFGRPIEVRSLFNDVKLVQDAKDFIDNIRKSISKNTHSHSTTKKSSSLEVNNHKPIS